VDVNLQAKLKQDKNKILNVSCNKCRTLKLCPELYQSRYNNQSNINVKQIDTILSALNVTQGYKRCYQTSSLEVDAKDAKPMDTILSALNNTQGYKRCYQTSSLEVNAKPMDTILSALIVNTDTSVAIKQAQNLKARSQLICFNT